jgi:putative transposase
MRDEFLDRELFGNLAEAKVLSEEYRQHYNEKRPHSGLGYQTPAGFAAGCIPSGSAPLRPAEYSQNQPQ